MNELGEIVSKLGKGEGFGDLALKFEGGVRQASVFSLEECDFLVIKRKTYLEIKEQLEILKNDKIRILQ